MIDLDDVTVWLGPHPVLQGACWHLRQGAKVGVVGRNGAGKTTLLRILAGDLEPSEGRIQRQGRVSLSWLHQQSVTASELPLWEEVRRGMTRIRALEDRLRAAEAAVQRGEAGAAARLDTALEQYRIGGGFRAEEAVGEVLDGLGFAPSDRDRPCADFSGGWRMRIALARHLLGDADIQLLDEPTNHLDMPARRWLADHLRRSAATVVVVSHDRWLLEEVVSETVEIRRGRLTSFRGPPSLWEAERAQRDAHAEATRRRVDAESAKLQAFVDRFGASATKAAAARSAERRMERLDQERPDAPLREERAPKMRLPEAPPSSTELVGLRGAGFGHPGGPSWAGVDWTIQRGERWVVVGPNGAGKSSLLSALSGDLALTSGRRQLGRDVVLAVHRQDLAAELPEEQTPLDHLRHTDSG